MFNSLKKKSTNRLMFLLLVGMMMLIVTNTVNAQNVGTGKVFGVNKPGDPKFNAFTPKFGDIIETTLYTPKDDSNKDLGLVKGQKYTMLMITQPSNNNAQAFIYWAADKPALQDKMLYKKTKVGGLGVKQPPLMRGDTFTIQTQPAKGGGLDVTFSQFRDKKGIGIVSFVVN
ncbi:MAG: hypothetical protein ACR2MG_05885 [Pyrinomonadaceae bacterium]